MNVTIADAVSDALVTYDIESQLSERDNKRKRQAERVLMADIGERKASYSQRAAANAARPGKAVGVNRKRCKGRRKYAGPYALIMADLMAALR